MLVSIFAINRCNMYIYLNYCRYLMISILVICKIVCSIACIYCCYQSLLNVNHRQDCRYLFLLSIIVISKNMLYCRNLLLLTIIAICINYAVLPVYKIAVIHFYIYIYMRCCCYLFLVTNIVICKTYALLPLFNVAINQC